jgi:adenylosuccinate lyase
MIERYEVKEITKIWTDEAKLALWQKTELAVIRANESLGYFPDGTYAAIKSVLESNPINIAWWKDRDTNVTKHDLNAFLDERRRFLPIELHQYWHQDITSYDTEETPFLMMLRESCAVVVEAVMDLHGKTLIPLAKKHRYTIMNGRTHGQEAELQTFGKRVLTWISALREDIRLLDASMVSSLKYSKISGALGNYGAINPEVEKKALEFLGFKPFYGATQILPRELHLPLAGALQQLLLTLEKIGFDVRLGARSGRPIYREPFGKKQKGSSAMPHKKNTILTENIQGLSRLGQSAYDAIQKNILTWEERSIEQSSVERVAWPDLFHVVVFALSRLNRVLKGLVVYPENMMREVVDSRGCYASNEAKELLKKLGVSQGIDGEIAYRIVQLAAFNVFEPSAEMTAIGQAITKSQSFSEIDEIMDDFPKKPDIPQSIKQVILKGELKHTDELDVTAEEVKEWNEKLRKIFLDNGARRFWGMIFTPSHLLRHEATLYKELLEC